MVACNKKQSDAPESEKPIQSSNQTFRILAGSELKDVADLVVAYGKTQNINVVFEYTGTLDAVDLLSDQNQFDAVWVSHGKYLQLIPSLKGKIKSSEKIMYSRVVLGVKPEVAKRLHWVTGKVGWNDIVTEAKAGKFHFAMTNPTGSNTGFVALAGLAAELSGKGDALEEKDIPSAKLKDLFIGQSMTAGSSGVLADKFLADPSAADGIINYESVIKTISNKGLALEIIIPKEGVITADYPLMLLADAKTPAFYQKLVEYLRTDIIQKQIAATTFRTPINGSGNDEVVNELPFPASLNVVDAILKGFLDEFSRPSTSYYILDVSGSMNGERIASLKDSMLALIRGDASTTGRFSTFHNRENIYLTPFSGEPKPTIKFSIGENPEQNKQIMNDMANSIQALRADGGTAIFTSIASIYPQAQAELKKENSTVSIILETDGVNTAGMNLESFRRFVQEQGEPRVPIYAILFGDGNPEEMKALAAISRGRVFDAKSTKLKKVMKDIRAYQ